MLSSVALELSPVLVKMNCVITNQSINQSKYPIDRTVVNLETGHFVWFSPNDAAAIHESPLAVWSISGYSEMAIEWALSRQLSVVLMLMEWWHGWGWLLCESLIDPFVSCYFSVIKVMEYLNSPLQSLPDAETPQNDIAEWFCSHGGMTHIISSGSDQGWLSSEVFLQLMPPSENSVKYSGENDGQNDNMGQLTCMCIKGCMTFHVLKWGHLRGIAPSTGHMPHSILSWRWHFYLAGCHGMESKWLTWPGFDQNRSLNSCKLISIIDSRSTASSQDTTLFDIWFVEDIGCLRY